MHDGLANAYQGSGHYALALEHGRRALNRKDAQTMTTGQVYPLPRAALKVFITLEGLGRQLDPQFDLTGELATVARRATLARYAPDVVLRRGRRTVTELVEVLTDLPRELRRLMGAVRSGTIAHTIDMAQLDDAGTRLDRAVNRLAVSLVTATLIVGTCIVIASGSGPKLIGVRCSRCWE
ncbi:MAG: hypothetical protein HOI95_17450 [Chromatiales bacterium]|nr:hypothetical protein [Chromatiales bacterium]